MRARQPVEDGHESCAVQTPRADQGRRPEEIALLALQRGAGNHAVTRMIERRPSHAALQRTYTRIAPDTDKDVVVTSAEDEFLTLNAAVGVDPSLLDIRGKWNLRPREVLVGTIERMISGSVSKEAGAIVREAVGAQRQPNRHWYFRDVAEAARAVLGESFRGEGEVKESKLAAEVLTGEAHAPIIAGVHAYMQKLENLEASRNSSACPRRSCFPLAEFRWIRRR
jgi:hypothetical protein